jgi:hypothetical protein
MKPDTFEQWLQIGIDHNWCTPVCCQTHDPTPMTDHEQNEFEQGFDPCIPIIRINESEHQ